MRDFLIYEKGGNQSGKWDGHSTGASHSLGLAFVDKECELLLIKCCIALKILCVKVADSIIQPIHSALVAQWVGM